MLPSQRRVDVQRPALKRQIIDIAREQRRTFATAEPRYEVPRGWKTPCRINPAHPEPPGPHSRLANRRVGFLMLRQRNQHAVPPEDSRLLPRDLANRVAKILG